MESKLKAKVIKSYFKGNYYLIEADLDGEVVFFENNESIKENQIVYLESIQDRK